MITVHGGQFWELQRISFLEDYDVVKQYPSFKLNSNFLTFLSKKVKG